MKFYVYAALIASTQAGPFAEHVKEKMAKAKDVAKVEDTIVSWFERAEELHYEAEPAVSARNKKWSRAWTEAGQREQHIAEDTFDALKENDERAVEQWGKSEERFQAAVIKSGADKDWEALQKKVDTDLQATAKYMENRKKATKALAARRAPEVIAMAKVADSVEQHAPTEAEIDHAEEVIAGWFERGAEIHKKATPAVEARNKRIEDAWNVRQAANEEVFWEGLEDLMKEQKKFEKHVMQAQASFEKAINDNGAVKDWEALGKKMESDIKKMEAMYIRVQELKTRLLTVQRANDKLAVSLGAVSDEMRKNRPVPEEVDACNVMITDWVERYEAIVAKVQPEEERRNTQIYHAFEDKNEEQMEIVGDMFEDWDKNDRMFWTQASSAHEAMEQRLKDEGVTKDMEDLLHEVDATLKGMAEGMYKLRRDTNAVSMGKVADHMRSNMLNGHEQAALHDMVTDWVEDYEVVYGKVKPLEDKRNAEWMRAEELRENSNIHTVTDAWADKQASDKTFWESGFAAERDMHARLEKDGVIAKRDALNKDIALQFKVWGMEKEIREMQQKQHELEQMMQGH